MEHEDSCFITNADTTAPYVIVNSTAELIETLTNITIKLFTWFANNQMKGNPDKSHLLLNTLKEVNIQIANTTIKCSRSRKTTGIDNKLKFDKYIENIYQKASRKLNVLARLTNYMELPMRRIFMNAFFKAQFSYCPVVWMFHTRSLNNKINRLHEQCLRIIYDDKHLHSEELLVKDKSPSIRQNNIPPLTIEMYTAANGMSPEIINDIFKLRGNTLSSVAYIIVSCGSN